MALRIFVPLLSGTPTPERPHNAVLMGHIQSAVPCTQATHLELVPGKKRDLSRRCRRPKQGHSERTRILRLQATAWWSWSDSNQPPECYGMRACPTSSPGRTPFKIAGEEQR